jgi:RND family efflux transporter MFP subunit
VQAEKAVEAARASVRSAASAIRSAQAAVQATKQSEAYLKVTAPFAGVITERFVHPGALVGPGSGSAGPLVELQQVTRLRLVVAVPEADVASVRPGTMIEFSVPAFPGRKFLGLIARLDRSLDAKTRTMPVEVDVANPRLELAPGMYPQAAWPTASAGKTLLVPATAVVTTTERTFVIRVKGGRVEWVDVKKGPVSGESVQVLGALSAGEQVVRRGSDEIREGSVLPVRK